jgi:hypothetical protein
MLTQRMQIQAIADVLAGLGPSDLPARDFDPPWRDVYRAVLEAPPGQAQEALIQAPAGHPDYDSVIGAIFAALPGDRLAFPSLQQIAASLPPVTWLWPGWIPQGMITLLGSAPGAGKSYLALDLARRVIAAEPFPDGAPAHRASENVIYVDAEDVPQIIQQRAALWGMDTSRLYLMQPEPGLFIDFSQPRDRDRLVEMAHTLRPALIVVDSLSSISSRGENNVEDVREVLGFLNSVAQSFRCGLLLVHHLRKRGLLDARDRLSIDDFRGSSHIVAIARSVLALSMVQVGPEPDRNSPRLLEVVKTNLARYPDPLGVEFRPGYPDGVVLGYGDPPQTYHPPTKVEQCMEWLVETLRAAGEPMRPREVEGLAGEEGFGHTTLYKARGRLRERVHDTQGRRHPGNRWQLKAEVEEES